MSDASDIASLNGSASYSGDAVGVYVRDVHSEGGGMLESSTSGHFVADVALTANFVGTSIPQNTYNMVTGSITNFVLSGGEDNDWAVNLEGMARRRQYCRERVRRLGQRRRSGRFVPRNVLR